MNRYSFIKSSLLIVLITSLFSFTAKAYAFDRTIEIAGLVVNAKDLSPVQSAEIYDADGKMLGKTDKNGYYDIHFNYTKSGELYFKLKIAKKGFQSFTQNEHWGNLGDTKSILYFGLKESGSRGKSFSSLANGNTNDLTYPNVLKGFDKVKNDNDFNQKLENAKAGNENVLVQVDGKYYIVDSNGWIEIPSDKEMVSIDNKQVIAADKLNTTIKRKDVKGMTPVNSKEAKFAIRTK
jgi:hypothetical protein